MPRPSLLTLFFTYFSEALIVFFYCQSIYSPKKGKAFSFATVFASYIVLMLIFKYINNDEIINILLTLTTNILLIYFIFNSSFKSAAFQGMTLAALQYITELITASAMAGTLNKSSTESVAQYFAIGSIISKMLYFLLSRLLVKMSLKEKRSKSWGRWALLAVLPISSVFVLLVIRILTADHVLPTFENLMNVFATFFLLIANIIVYMIYEKSEQSNQKLVELELTNQRNRIDLKYMTLLEKKNEDMKIMTHDYKKHIMTIEAMADNPEISEYLQSMLSEINHYNQIGKSKNKILDVIIGKYVDICIDKNINFVTEIMSDNLSSMNSKDISSLFNNVMDNAVESACESKARNIFLNISSVLGSFHRITVSNSCDAPPKVVNEKLITKKHNKETHGFGTKSITKTVKKYYGEVEWQYDEIAKEFKLIIIIPFEQKQPSETL